MRNLPGIFNRNSFTGNPLRDLMRMQRQMSRMTDRFFDELWNPGSFDLQMSPFNAPAFTPTSDVQETETHYLMSFDLPGVKKDDIKIDLRDDVLTVSGERKEEREDKAGQRQQSERFYGAFQRSFLMPQGTKPEQIEAQYSDGVLRVAVPKTEASKAQEIKVSEGKSGFWDKLLGQKEHRPQVKAV